MRVLDDNHSIEKTNHLLKEKLLKLLPKSGSVFTAVNGLMISRRDEANKVENCFYRPSIGVIVQGTKCCQLGNSTYRYGQNYCMVSGVDMPSINHMVDISPEEPFLALSIELDRYLMTQLSAETLPQTSSENQPSILTPEGVIIEKASNEILGAFLRLVELLDTPNRISFLAPMIIREIHYYLLISSQGEKLRSICTLGSQSNRVAQAITWLRENYREPFNVDELAKLVYMAPSSFHRHFRIVTTMSPLQFQKRLRLYEAQRLMLAESKDALTAALAVGYASATQFNREYKRQFGEPPHRDINKKRLFDTSALM